MMTKDLELQNSNCSCAPKPNIDTFCFQKAYLAHFEINFSDSCGLVALVEGLQISLSSKNNNAMPKFL
jgi:hypothetical protein